MQTTTERKEGGVRLAISRNEIIKSDVDWKVRQLKDTVLLNYIKFANDLGLHGKKIKEVVVVEPVFTNALYIDFVTESDQGGRGEYLSNRKI